MNGKLKVKTQLTFLLVGFKKSRYKASLLGKERFYDCYYRFSIDIFVKDGKYKYVFSNFVVDGDLTPGFGIFPALTTNIECPVKLPVGRDKSNALYGSMKEELKKDVENIFENLKSRMIAEKSDEF